MTKPVPTTMEVLDWLDCTRYLEATHGIKTRDYANSHAQYREWCAATGRVMDTQSQAQYAEYVADINAGKVVERPYQDFWHFLCDQAPIQRGGLLRLHEAMGEGAEPWQREILGLYLGEFGEGPYLTDW